MKDERRKKLGNILFILTLFSPLMAFALVTTIGEVEIFGSAGMIKYLWVMWLFIPIGVLSILIGVRLKNNFQRYKKNIVIGAIFVPILAIFGSYSFIFASNFSYDANIVKFIEERTKLDLPDEVKVGTESWDDYYISYAKITNTESKKAFDQEIKSSLSWKRELSPKIKMILPSAIQYEVLQFDYFVFYNVTNDEYNTFPSDGKYECIFIAYDVSLARLMILSDYKIDLS